MLDEATDQGEKAVVAIPGCRPDVTAKEQEMRTKFEEKSLKLTDARTGLLGKMTPELIITDVLPIQAAPTANAHLLFKKQDFPTFDGQRRNYPTFKRVWRESVSETGVDLILQLSMLKKGCPKAVEADLKNISSLDKIWRILD